MKYIRTKDGRIIDLTGWLSLETVCVNAETDEVTKDICYQRTWFEQHGDSCEYKTEHISHNGQVLKTADTIEELCDWFVDVDNKNKIQAIYSNLPNRMEGLFGAIETDKGLIYVAKMNEKGELCLI